MTESRAENGRRERAYLIGLRFKKMTRRETQEHLDELESLAATLELDVVAADLVTVHTPSQTYLVGTGKAEEIKAAAEMAEADMIVFDDDLSPSQQRNWEKLTKKVVIDRREMILEIFNSRAHTKEARLQVDLARQEYELPRLKRAWTHLERQRGGAGFVGGAGEAQIEVDRRLVRDSISKLKRELEVVRRQRATQRKARRGVPVPTVSLVGYTNSGKSTLLNRLTDANVLAEDKLFATLDPTTRRLALPNGQDILLTDTVGFIRKLPHSLIDAFKATLEEAQLADFILHVVDASHPAALDHIQTTNEVLEELKADYIPMLYVLNKVDAVEDQTALAALRQQATPSVSVSALTGEGIDALLAELTTFSLKGTTKLWLRVPPRRSDLQSLIHKDGTVHHERYDGEDAVLLASVPARHLGKVADFVTEEPIEVVEAGDEEEAT